MPNISLQSYLAHQAKFPVAGWQSPGTRPEVLERAEGCENESVLHNAIIEHCKMVGWIYFHGSMAHKAMRTVGEPDFTILANRGRVFFVECKTKIGKLSMEQLGLKQWAERLGHTIHVCRSAQEFFEIVTGGPSQPTSPPDSTALPLQPELRAPESHPSPVADQVHPQPEPQS